MDTTIDLIRYVPFALAAGLEELNRSANGATMRLPFVPHMAEGDPQTIAKGALAGLMDHAMGAGIVGAGLVKGRLSTVELRIDWLAHMLPGMAAVASATFRHALGEFLLVDCVVTRAGDEVVVATAVGTFLHTQRVSSLAPSAGPTASTPSLSLPFTDFLGLRREGSAFDLTPKDHLMGNVDPVAIHGGMICAAVIAAAEEVAEISMPNAFLSNLSLRYLAPVNGDAPSRIDVTPGRIGRRTGWFAVSISQGEHTDVAVAAECLFGRVSGIK